jgi:mRNA interferase YafQ
MNATTLNDRKRASRPRASDFSKDFKKDWERLSRSGRFNMRLLKEVMVLLVANDGVLGPERLDHALKGDWADHRECHVGGDFLLIYRIVSRGSDEAVVFVRCGTHASLFGE